LQRTAARSPRWPEDRLGQGLFVETERGVAIGETTVDDDSRQAANAVAGGCYCGGGFAHVANFDIVLGACQKLDQFHSLGAARATSCKDLDFSALSHVVPLTCSDFAQLAALVSARVRSI
jgi:hypothetical protein